MKTVLISGAGSGLGEALAIQYAESGYDVCVCDINAQAAKAVVDALINRGGSAFYVPCDITQQSQIDRLFDEVSQRWGSLDILVNNAGVATAGLLEYESTEQWQWVLDINVIGHVRMSKAFVPLIRRSNAEDRMIINIASQAGLTPAPGMGSYSVSKAAMVSFSETLYLELAHESIHVCVACPSFFNTNLNTSLRSGQPDMSGFVTKMIKSSGVDAQVIAKKILEHATAKKFMAITHKDGRMAYRLKRFLPIDRYLKIMRNRTKRMLQRNVSQ
jgi:NAD(P)-dependent dehydrogenase (short-subunit alcohol dehydrogenase family)